MGRILRLLSEETGFSLFDLLAIASSASKRYKVFEIKKRSGGMREIAQPARELKTIQRVLVEKLLNDLPVHSVATAYRAGLSIRDNAAAHAFLTPLLKLDFQEFFPSLVSDDWEKYCKEKNLLEDDDIALTTKFFFRKRKGEQTLRLSIGAPSSPAMSNVLMYEFDSVISGYASTKGINFTRYADDLSFSGQRIGMLRDVEAIVDTALRNLVYPKLKINHKKTTYITKSFRRSVTGLVIDNNDGRISLGHGKKRNISATVHHASLNKLGEAEMQKLCGTLAFVNVAEPLFLDRLKAKYGDALIRKIQRSVSIPSV